MAAASTLVKALIVFFPICSKEAINCLNLFFSIATYSYCALANLTQLLVKSPNRLWELQLNTIMVGLCLPGRCFRTNITGPVGYYFNICAAQVSVHV